MMRALIFDFDGLILDTETPEMEVWQAIYREYGHELPVDEWAKTVGGFGISTFNPAQHLAELTGQDAEELVAYYRQKVDPILQSLPVRPGVQALLEQAAGRGVLRAVASSSSHQWVDTHLARLGLLHYFDWIVCSEDVPPGRTKPNPDLYLVAVERLGVPRETIVVFEDSQNGVRAARAAGLFVVAVPNPLTQRLGVDGADYVLPSLAEISLERLERLLAGRILQQSRSL